MCYHLHMLWATGHVLSFAHALGHWACAPAGVRGRVQVSKHCRGLGVGTQLMLALEAHAKEQVR